MKYVLIFSTALSETLFILRRIEQDITINVYCSSWKYPLFLSDFNKIKFSLHILEKYWDIKFN